MDGNTSWQECKQVHNNLHDLYEYKFAESCSRLLRVEFQTTWELILFALFDSELTEFDGLQLTWMCLYGFVSSRGLE